MPLVILLINGIMQPVIAKALPAHIPPAVLYHSTLYIPIRITIEWLGGRVDYDSSEKVIICTVGGYLTQGPNIFPSNWPGTPSGSIPVVNMEYSVGSNVAKTRTNNFSTPENRRVTLRDPIFIQNGHAYIAIRDMVDLLPGNPYYNPESHQDWRKARYEWRQRNNELLLRVWTDEALRFHIRRLRGCPL